MKGRCDSVNPLNIPRNSMSGGPYQLRDSPSSRSISSRSIQGSKDTSPVEKKSSTPTTPRDN